MVRKDILEKMEKNDAVDEESSSEEDTKIKENRKKGLSIIEEENLVKEEFKRAAEINDTEDEEFLTKRIKTAEEQKQFDNEYKAFLSTSKFRKKKDSEIIQNYWFDENISEDEKFLRRYIMNKEWEADEAAVPTYEEIVDDDEDEEEIEKQDNFEASYNFRFEEPGGTEIATYQRFPKDSVRKPDSKRKEKRKKREARKSKEEKQRLDEKKRLIKLKKLEIIDRLKTIQQITGTTDAALKKIDLEEEFDPEKYEKQMNDVFNEEYYANEEEKKPIFEHEEGEEYNSVADKYLENKAKEKPNDEKLNEYLEEYFKLDYEDMIGDDIPCRFKYTQTKPINFGLNPLQILEKDDSELRRRFSTKRLQPYREENDVIFTKQRQKSQGKHQRRKTTVVMRGDLIFTKQRQKSHGKHQRRKTTTVMRGKTGQIREIIRKEGRGSTEKRKKS